jgi:hypothetical protein
MNTSYKNKSISINTNLGNNSSGSLSRDTLNDFVKNIISSNNVYNNNSQKISFTLNSYERKFLSSNRNDIETTKNVIDAINNKLFLNGSKYKFILFILPHLLFGDKNSYKTIAKFYMFDIYHFSINILHKHMLYHNFNYNTFIVNEKIFSELENYKYKNEYINISVIEKMKQSSLKNTISKKIEHGLSSTINSLKRSKDFNEEKILSAQILKNKKKELAETVLSFQKEFEIDNSSKIELYESSSIISIPNEIISELIVPKICEMRCLLTLMDGTKTIGFPIKKYNSCMSFVISITTELAGKKSYFKEVAILNVEYTIETVKENEISDTVPILLEVIYNQNIQYLYLFVNLENKLGTLEIKNIISNGFRNIEILEMSIIGGNGN